MAPSDQRVCSGMSVCMHIAGDMLVGSKVRYLSNFPAAPHFGERLESALPDHSVFTAGMALPAPSGHCPTASPNGATGWISAVPDLPGR